MYVKMTWGARACLHVSEKDSATQQRAAESLRCAGHCRDSRKRCTTRRTRQSREVQLSLGEERSDWNCWSPFQSLKIHESQVLLRSCTIYCGATCVVCVSEVSTNCCDNQTAAPRQRVFRVIRKEQAVYVKVCAQRPGAGCSHWDRWVLVYCIGVSVYKSECASRGTRDGYFCGKNSM